MQHFEFVFVVLYSPNWKTPSFCENLKDLLFNYYDSLIIYCEDWNLVQRYNLDTFGNVREKKKNDSIDP